MGTTFIDFTNPQNSLNNCNFIALDTCSIINLASGKQDAIDFAKFTIQNNIALCYTIKSIEELNIIQEANTIPKDKRIALPNMKSYIQQSQIKADNILTTIHKLPNMYPDPIGNMDCDVLKQIRNNASLYGLRLGDAAIYTLAKQNDINYIWTYDKDWTNIEDNNMNILTERRFIPGNGTVINLPNTTMNYHNSSISSSNNITK